MKAHAKLTNSFVANPPAFEAALQSNQVYPPRLSSRFSARFAQRRKNAIRYGACMTGGTLHLWRVALLFLAFSLPHTPAAPQTLSYTTIDVGGRLTVTVPSHWRVRDTAERQNIAAGSDAALNPTGKPSGPMHVSSLSVVSNPEPIRAIVRVSFLQDAGTQVDLIREVSANRSKVIAEFKASWEAEKHQAVEAMSRQGIQYLGQEEYRIETIGARTALVISYKRSSLKGGAPFVVTQYHVPMGSDKVLVTLSFQESEAALFRPILERVKNSIAIRR